jgi:hypothetical protein
MYVICRNITDSDPGILNRVIMGSESWCSLFNLQLNIKPHTGSHEDVSCRLIKGEGDAGNVLS